MLVICIGLKNRDILSIDDLSKEEIVSIIETASEAENIAEPILKGKIMATLFFEPSTRTRLSFESAMLRLGGNVLGFSNPDATSFSKGESLSDAAKMIENYCDIMVVRSPIEGAVKTIADASKIPVINAGDGSNEHPTQILADLYSMKKSQGRLEGLNIALVGDLKYGRTVHSLIRAGRHFSMNFFLVSPRELAMPEELLKGIVYSEHTQIQEIMHKADIIYMTRIQKERFMDLKDYERLKDSYVLRQGMLEKAKKTMKIMHPLPRVNEISADVDDTRHAYYFEQAKNAVSARKSLLLHVFGKR